MSEHEDNIDLDDIRALVEERVDSEDEEFGEIVGESSPAFGSLDDPRFVLSCLSNNERGDGILYAALHRGKVLCNKSKKDKPWMIWGGHHWKYDYLDEAVRAVEAVALKYLAQSGLISDEIAELRQQLADVEEQAENCRKAEDAEGQKAKQREAERLAQQINRLSSKRKSLDRRVDRLRSWPGANKCLNWASCVESPLAIKGDEIDRQPWLLGCLNGVVDLRTGLLRPGDPEDYLVRAVSLSFPEGPEVEHYLATGEGFQAPAFERFMDEIHQSDQEIIDCIHRLLGYSITGLNTEHYLGCFIGDGANGKGTLFELLLHILGELAWSIDPEMVMQQKNAKTSGGPDPEIISLHGRRLAIASETEENRRISAAKVKRLTGGDTLKARAPHDKYEINFEPSHTLVLVTNHPPRGLAADFAMFRRLLYFWYPLRYVDDPEHHARKDPQNAAIFRKKDPDLPARLRKEAPWVLAWLVRGCLLWQAAGGINPPDKLRAAAEEIRRNEDHLEQFIEAGCEHAHPEDWVLFKDFYARFKTWYEENVDESSRYRPSNKVLTDQLRRKGFRVPPGKETGGQVRVYGLSLPPVWS